MAAFVTIVANKSGPEQTFRIAGYSTEKDGYPFRGLLINQLQLEGKLKVNETGNQVRSVQLYINNVDAYIPHDCYMWGATVTIQIDGISETFVGVVDSYATDKTGVLGITVIEETYEIFKQMIPDEVARIGTYSDMQADFTNMVIPTVFGGTSLDPIRVRGILIDKVRFIYAFCVGEIQNFFAIYSNKETEDPGKYTTYKGTAGQTDYPGIAYVQFTADPRGDDGQWPEVFADITGLKLWAMATEDECRNPARVMKYLLVTPNSGPCGWGLGVDISKLDTTSFNGAASACSTLGFKLDGILTDRKAAGLWINEISKACRGSLTRENGKYKFTIAADSASIYAFAINEMEITGFRRGSVRERKNRVILDYRYAAVSGRMVSSAIRDDAAHQTAHGLVESRVSLLLVRDHATAGKIADYMLRLEAYGAEYLTFNSPTLPSGAAEGKIITINRSDKGIASEKYIISKITQGEKVHTYDVRSYDSAIFDTTDPGTLPLDPSFSDSVGGVYRPGTPSGLSIVEDIEQMADGKTNIHIHGSFTPPEGIFLFATVQYGIGANPVAWFTVGQTVDGTFKINGLLNNTVYTVKITPYNGSGAGEAVTAQLTTGIDATIPGVPSISTSTTTGGIVVSISYSAPADFSGFEIVRAKGDGTGETTINMDAKSRTFTDSDPTILADYTLTWKYKVRARDWSGNLSNYSGWTDAISPSQADTKDLKAASVTAAIIRSCQITTCHISTCGISADCVKTGALISTNWCTTAGSCFDLAAGTFKLGGSSAPKLSWDGTSLSITGAVCATSGTFTGTVCASSGCFTGTITSCAGTIAGWTLAAGSLSAGSAGTKMQLEPATGIWMGADAFANAPFRVSPAGALTATNATICGTVCACAGCFSGTLNAGAGTIGGWCLSTDCLYAASANAKIKTSTSAGAGANGVVIDCTGIYGYSSTLGTVFSLPSSGAAPTFSSGCIVNTVYCISTSGVMRTSANALYSCAGVLINDTGIYISDATTACPALAKIRLLSSGCGFFCGCICAGSGYFGGTLGAGIVCACNIAAGTIQACNIAAGTITGDKIAAGTISTTSLLVASPGSALNNDPAFEDACNQTMVCGCIVTITDGCVGSKAFRTRCAGYGAISECCAIPVNPEKWYRRSVKIRAVGGTGGVSYFYDYALDANKNNLGSISKCFGKPPACWQTYTCVFQYPAGTRYATIRLDINNGAGAGVYVEAQDNRLEEVLPATLIQDGAIISAKIAANAVCACHLVGKGLCSDNWGASAGSCFDLCAGTFKLGGSSAPALEWNGSALTARGTICSCCGNIGGFLICNDGLCASKDCGNGMCSLACLSATDLCSGLNLRGYTLLGGSNYDCSFLSLRQYRNKAELYLYSDLCCNTSRYQDFVCITSSANTISGPNIFVCTSKGPAATLCVNTACDTGDRWALRVVSNLDSPAVYVTGHVCVGGIIGSSGSNGIQIGSNSSQMWSETNCAAYNRASLQLREANLCCGAGCAPSLAFHWGGVVASQIGIQSSGRIAVLDNPGTGYENLIAKTIYSTGGICNDSAVNLCIHGGTSAVTCFPAAASNCFVLGCAEASDSYALVICKNACSYGVRATTNKCSIDGYAHSCIGVMGYGYSCIGVYGVATCYGMIACATCYNGFAAYARSGCAGVFCSPFPSVYANCGAYILGCLCYQYIGQMSQRCLKKNVIQAHDCDDFLSGIRGLDLFAFQYCNDDSGKWGFGPMAEDFACAFPWLGDGRGVPNLGSIAVRGVQELDGCVTSMKRCISDLETRLSALECRLPQAS